MLSHSGQSDEEDSFQILTQYLSQVHHVPHLFRPLSPRGGFRMHSNELVRGPPQLSLLV